MAWFMTCCELDSKSAVSAGCSKLNSVQSAR
jgi:hypothetical protein